MPGSDVRTPRLTVLADGTPLPNLLDAEVEDNAHFAAARFRIRLAVDPASANALLQPGTILDIQVSVDGSAGTSLLQGEADVISLDALRRVAVIEGRDLTARLLDARTQETFSNQTASEIAKTLAARHRLQADVTATTTLAGRYYEAEHDRLTLGQFSRATTEWDLLAFLAAHEGFEVFVAGQTLTFAPPSPSGGTMQLTPNGCLGLHLEHALTLARDIEVTVKSWNARQQNAFTQTARSSARTGRRGSPPQRIVVVRPNLQAEDALKLAQRILADLSAHERLVHAELPGELSLTPRSRVSLSGTGTDFDQRYYVAEIHRHIDDEHGYVQRIRLKNTPPGSDATAGTTS